MSMTEKVDVLDLIIEVLKEHEKALDAIAERLEKALGVVDDEEELRLMRRFYSGFEEGP